MKKLKKHINNYLSEDRLKYYLSTSKNNLELESGFSEYWIQESTNGKRIGEGNFPIDIEIYDNNKKFGVDVSCLCYSKSNNKSNEKSIIQNFKNDGCNIDSLFNNKNYETILKQFKNLLITKYKKPKILNFHSFYYLFFISTNEHIYLSLFKINPNLFNSIKIDEITKSGKSIILSKFINNMYGEVKIYQSKKRMEIRFNKSILDHPYTKLIY